jgi:TRAP-type C4-dicarboxylate transport system substrate-binding protein
MFRKSLVFFVALFLFSSLFILGNSQQSFAKSYKWRLFLYYPPQVSDDYEGWVKDIKEKTKGGLDIKVFYHGEHPFKGADLLAALKDRSCDMANVNSAYTGGAEPLLSCEVPMLNVNTKTHLYVVEKTRNKWYEAILKKWNQKLLIWGCYPGQSIQIKDTFVDSFDSLKGKKLRIYNKDTANFAKVLNATPITIPWAEVYTAAQRGVIDGATGALGVVYDSKWYEVFKYITVTEFVMSIDGINVNLDAWKEIPEEYRNIILETAKEWQARYWKRRELVNHKKNVLAQEIYGCKATYMNPRFRKEVVKRCEKNVWPDWIQRTGQPEKAKEYINDCIKYRNEFLEMDKKKQKTWLITHGFPKEVLE